MFGVRSLGCSRAECVVRSVGVERVVLWVWSFKERVRKNDEEVVRVAGYRSQIINV